ncbi:1-phosphatidylinositol 4,5-bisphosphate phosphodiesterase zeta-1-like [Genypterus blacodes]|uniref:1-phosphatidylinositol 4,5-bisphosphate phosphodiesterase zeta-1-like n=1 Tax=Genypterus blacodes TaxID=154954 RepID=UPI003F75E1C9
MELTATEETADALIDRYEIDPTAIQSKCMTFEGFLRYMESNDCCVFDQSHNTVYQDMDKPLSSYFISSSHNTYLTGNQLTSKSHLSAYISALTKGCRCLEIDCWDGPNADPIVYHGYTLTKRLLFKDVVTTVEQHAFDVSPFPLILSLENHCCLEQQEVMAQYLDSILGDKLLKTPCDHLTSGELPSPNDLKYKILIKNKKIKTEEPGESTEQTEEEDSQTKSKSAKLKRRRVMVAEGLSDLVIYTGSVKFITFSHSQEYQSIYENTSMDEKKSRELAQTSGAEFVQHNQKFLTRIYPAGSRVWSTNYNPQQFWNVGSQLVALNFQTPGLAMNLNDGRFQDNGGCGYVLKPPVLMSSDESFDPNQYQPSETPTQLMLKVIGGSNLPLPRTGKPLDPFVRVDIEGIPSDSVRKHTHSVKNNSLAPSWEVDMSFDISVPELCLVRFSVRDQVALDKSEFVGQYTLPFTSMKKGYRWVPLLSKDGCRLDPASLFILVHLS